MANYDFYRQLKINGISFDVLIDLTREKIILQFGDDNLLKFLNSLNEPIDNYKIVTIGSDN